MKIQTLLKSIFGVVVTVLLLPIMSCDSANNLSALVGHWLHESGGTEKTPQDMELFKDGTGMCDGNSILWKIDNKRLTIQSLSLGVVSDYELSDYRLTLTDNGKKITYLNINNENYQKSLQKGTFTDSRDGKKYGTVKINTQTWFAENLNYETAGGKCYDNNSANCDKYGRLYNWETAMKACPNGWHLPSNEEWQTLVNFTGGNKIAGKKFKARSGWNSNKGKSSNGTDIFGFSALPGGYSASDGLFYTAGYRGLWWTTPKIEKGRGALSSPSEYGNYLRIFYDNEYIGYRYSEDLFCSIRCLQD